MDCLFCKIAKGEIYADIIREDDNFMAFLDLFPNRKGMTLVIPKKHTSPDLAEVEESILSQGILVTQKMMQLLKKKLGVPRVGLVTEGLEVPHLHFKLYPFRDGISYPNGTNSGPKADAKELAELAQYIKN